MIKGKRKLCFTETSDFINIQGVGNDPIYRRYNSVYAVVKQCIDEPYRSFLAEPEYSIEDDQIYWYVEEWGEGEEPVRMANLSSEEYQLCKHLLQETVAHYSVVANSLLGENQMILKSAIKFINDEFVYLANDHVILAIWGMTPDTSQHTSIGKIVHEVDLSRSHKIIFDAGSNGTLVNKMERSTSRKEGTILSVVDLPKVKAHEQYEFIEWHPNPVGVQVNSPLTFKAIYNKVELSKTICHIQFIGNDLCTLSGNTEFDVEVGSVFSESQIPKVITKNNAVFVGWAPDIHLPIIEDIVYKAKCQDEPKLCHVRFVGNAFCSLTGITEINVPQGSILTTSQIPKVIVGNGIKFVRWTEDVSLPIQSDKTFYTSCEEIKPLDIKVIFNVGDNGSLVGVPSLMLPVGTKLVSNQIPSVKPKSGYNFMGWDKSPLELALHHDTTFNAIYEKQQPWYKGLWLWFTERGCLTLLFRLLLLLLLLLLLWFILRSCNGDSTTIIDNTNGPAVIDTLDNIFKENPGNAEGGQIGNIPSTPIDQPDLGEGINPGNGDNDYHIGILPQDPSIIPIDNPDDPQGPQIIPNVINVFFTKENANLNAFAKDFRSLYPDTQKYLLDYDDYVKRVSIMMPTEERVSLKQNIEKELGEKYNFIIVDEFAIQQNISISTRSVGTGGDMDKAGWHLIAVHAPQAWKITLGDSDITVAVVDDGCDTNHDMFKGKIISPYNVITKSSTLTYGSGHGTHTAGLAAGLIRSDGKAAGLAPGCKLMPIQVFDGKHSCISAEVSGIAYAIHKGADVVNISMGCSYANYKGIAEEEQERIAKHKGTIEEILWRRVFKMAKERNVILVFSAGNDEVVSYLNPQNRPDSIISVTAITPQYNESNFTNYGRGSTIASPGTAIYSTMPQNSFGMMQGTSQAAPIVAGTVALMKSIRKNLTASEAIDILKRSGKTLKNYKLGPLLQADRALILLQTGKLPNEGGNEDSRRNIDYSEILRQIAEHQRAIGNLIQKLPIEEQKKLKK